MHGVASSLDRLGLAACPGECLLVTCSIACDCRERPVPVHFARPGWNIGHQLYAIRRYQLKLTIARRMYASDLKNPGSARRAGVFCWHFLPMPQILAASAPAIGEIIRRAQPSQENHSWRNALGGGVRRHLCDVELV
jgi:hypothetical protein